MTNTIFNADFSLKTQFTRGIGLSRFMMSLLFFDSPWLIVIELEAIWRFDSMTTCFAASFIFEVSFDL